LYGLVSKLYKKIEAVEMLSWLWQDAKGEHLFVGLVVGVAAGLFYPVVIRLSYPYRVTVLQGLFYGVFDGLFYGVFCGVFYGVFSGLFGRLDKKIEVVETLHWSWRDAKGSRLFVGP